MDWKIFFSLLPILGSILAILTSGAIIYVTFKINKIRMQQATFDKDASETKFNITKMELSSKTTLLEETKKLTDDISNRISRQLIEDPTWLDRFMDQTGATYSASLYGNRISHFYYEKKSSLKEQLKKSKIT